MTTIDDLITESVTHDQIAHATATPELLADLTAQCDDSVQNDDVMEFWGTRDDGEEWRVHLTTGLSAS